MGISISPSSWISNLSKNKERDLKTADYLDQIAEEANGLANIWENVAVSILSTGIADAKNDTVWIRLVERPEWTIYSKNIPRSRIEIFYEKVSSVLGKNNRSEMDFLICRIGAILQKRKLTREVIEEELKGIKDVRFFDKTSEIKQRITIAESISLLKKEAKALVTLANEYRKKI